ncbi:hypothetical protein DFH08DRAFT_819301 [Mycena albidolilacea]|uniref:Uncharacterized protein n=1 Tax=Mycena albidolilacea TaxID=1033008 RepID=A0AAD6ZEM0_9AGAR|nr:hypothetical protein DFH08DRAFT_819301 [Mycena albidolilacea]
MYAMDTVNLGPLQHLSTRLYLQQHRVPKIKYRLVNEMPAEPQGGMASKISLCDRTDIWMTVLHYVKVAGLEQLVNEVLTRSQDAREVGDEVLDVYKEIISQARQRRLCATPSTHDLRSRLQGGRNGRGANPGGRSLSAVLSSANLKSYVLLAAVRIGACIYPRQLDSPAVHQAGCNSEILQSSEPVHFDGVRAKKSPGDEPSNDKGEKDNFMITPFNGGEKEMESESCRNSRFNLIGLCAQQIRTTPSIADELAQSSSSGQKVIRCHLPEWSGHHQEHH